MKLSYRALGGVAIVVFAVAVVFGNHAIAFVKSGYPSDPIRREALDRCAAADSHFLRYLAKDRAGCYKSSHIEDAAAASR